MSFVIASSNSNKTTVITSSFSSLVLERVDPGKNAFYDLVSGSTIAASTLQLPESLTDCLIVLTSNATITSLSLTRPGGSSYVGASPTTMSPGVFVWAYVANTNTYYRVF